MKLRAIDLFAGAGGTSTGLALADDELAAAMSFPTDYDFAGTRTDIIRQIGNAVPVSTARALCRGILEQARGVA